MKERHMGSVTHCNFRKKNFLPSATVDRLHSDDLVFYQACDEHKDRIIKAAERGEKMLGQLQRTFAISENNPRVEVQLAKHKDIPFGQLCEYLCTSTVGHWRVSPYFYVAVAIMFLRRLKKVQEFAE